MKKHFKRLSIFLVALAIIMTQTLVLSPAAQTVESVDQQTGSSSDASDSQLPVINTGENNQSSDTVKNNNMIYGDIAPQISGDIGYVLLDGDAFITGYYGTDENAVIPETIDGHPVVGINNIYSDTITSMTLPDSVKFLSSNWLSAGNISNISIGKSVKKLNCYMFRYDTNLESIEISADNPYFTSVDGVVYSKDMSTLVVYPLGKGTDYTVPAETTNIDILRDGLYSEINVSFEDSSDMYVTVDGVTYTTDMTRIIHCSPDKTGEYQMPGSVNKIDLGAFENCTQLESVSISENVTDIVYRVFANCTALKSVNIPSSVKTIDGYAFEHCDSLQEAVIPDSVTSIGMSAFEECNSMTNVEIGNGVKQIDFSAFYGCDELETLTLGKSIETIDYNSFSGCAKLKNVDFPDSLTNINGSAFSGCENLTELKIPDSVTEIGSMAFASCTSLESVTIGNGLKSIEYGLFTDCTGLKNVNIGSGVKVINDSAFNRCNSLEKIVVPKNVEEIRSYAFACCQNLSDVTLNDGLTYIDSSIFNESKIYTDKSNWKDGVLYVGNYLIAAEPSTVNGDTYEYNQDGISGTCVVKPGTQSIANYAFANCTMLEGIELPDGLIVIGRNAFENCLSLTKVEIPDSITAINDATFARCSSLETVVIPESVNYIGINAFLNCDKLENAPLPKEIEIIDQRAYFGSGLTSLTIPDTVTDIVYATFMNSPISEINMPDKLVSIGGHSFDGTVWYDNQPEGEVYLGRMLYTYKGTVPENTSISIKDNTLGISDYAFGDQIGLVSVDLPDGLIEIGESAFSGTGLTKIKIPESVTHIGGAAFADTLIEEAYIPASVASMGEYNYAGDIFIRAPKLKNITVSPDNSSYASIDGVLYNKDATELIYCPENKTGVFTIPGSVKRVCSSAFNNTSLTGIIVNNDNIIFDVGAINYSNENMVYIYGNEGSTAEDLAESHGQPFIELVNQTDDKTGITIVDSNNESIPENARLSVVVVEETADMQTFDISLKKDGKDIQPNGSVTVKIPAESDKYKVYRQETDGSYTDMKAAYSNGYLVFETSHFSTYVLTTKSLGITLGDVDGDGSISTLDATLILQNIAGIINWDDNDAKNKIADVDESGTIDTLDATLVLQMIAGII